MHSEEDSRVPSRRAVLLTGSPSSGKTTIIQRALASCASVAGGFVTQEIRVGSVRKGFDIVTLDGNRGVLARVDIRGCHRVGRYGVDLNALETLGVRAIEHAIEAGRLVVIDEIGPMELLSDRFRAAVLHALNSLTTVLGTLVKRAMPFTQEIKTRDDVEVIEVRPDNREAVMAQILDWLRRQQCCQ